MKKVGKKKKEDVWLSASDFAKRKEVRLRVNTIYCYLSRQGGNYFTKRNTSFRGGEDLEHPVEINFTEWMAEIHRKKK